MNGCSVESVLSDPTVDLHTSIVGNLLSETNKGLSGLVVEEDDGEE